MKTDNKFRGVHTGMNTGRIHGRFASLRTAIILGAALVMSALVSSVRAGQPQLIPAYYDDQIEHVIPGVSGNVVGVNNTAIATRVANPIYVVLPVSDQDAQQVDHVLGVAIPGVAGYNPYWDVVYVTVLNGRDLTTNPFTSESEILTAYLNGEVDLNDTGFILLCQVISK
jgi:hypothetical protein